MQVGNRSLLVKVPRDFSGHAVEGRLVEVPERVRVLVSETKLYDWMLDAEHSFRGDWNLPLVLAILLVGRARSVLNHREIAALAAHGDPTEVIARIEEISALGDAAHVGPYWISPSWSNLNRS